MELFNDYCKNKHLLSRIDARVKMLVALLLLGMVLSYRGYLFPLIVAGLCLCGCLMLKVPLRLFILRFSEPLFLALVVIVLKVFFSGQDVLFSLSIMGCDIVGYRDGLREGLMIGSRILGAVSVVALMGFSTPFTDVMAGLSWLRIPRGFIEILMFAYRYIFVLLDDAHVIYNAQKNRLGYSSMRRGLASFGVLAGSLTLKAFDHSQSTAVAMVQRGYDGNIPLLRHKSFKFSEVAASLVLLAVLGCLWGL